MEFNTKKICDYCKKEYIPVGYGQKYCCKECKAEAYKNHSIPSTKKKKVANSSLVDIAVKARKAGMTYGQYVAMEHLNER